MKTEREFYDEFTTRSATEWFDEEIKRYKGMVEEMERYKRNYLESRAKELAGDTGEQPERYLSWSLNSMKSLGFNQRIDMVPDIVVKHAVARTVAK